MGTHQVADRYAALSDCSLSRSICLQGCSLTPAVSLPVQLWNTSLYIAVDQDQVANLAEHAHVYMTKDGRISMAGLNEHNIQVS